MGSRGQKRVGKTSLTVVHIITELIMKKMSSNVKSHCPVNKDDESYSGSSGDEDRPHDTDSNEESEYSFKNNINKLIRDTKPPFQFPTSSYEVGRRIKLDIRKD